MNENWVQERIDELYLIEKQAKERLDRFEKAFGKMLEVDEKKQRQLQELIQLQRGQAHNAEQKTKVLHEWYKWLLKAGALALIVIFTGILVIFAWWWHVDNMVIRDQALQKYVLSRYNQLPKMVKHNGNTYIRIVPNTIRTELTKPDGSLYPGAYARVYLNQEGKSG